MGKKSHYWELYTSFAENFVAQELFSGLNYDLIAWSKGQAEIEFLINQGEHTIPIEVKSSKRSRRSKSLDSFVDRYKPVYLISS